MANETQEASAIDSTIIIAVVGAISAALGAAVSGFWSWFGGKRKADMEAVGSLMNGFKLLLDSANDERELLKGERKLLVERINDLESNNQRQDRHISRLVRIMISKGLKVPEEPDEDEDRSGR